MKRDFPFDESPSSVPDEGAMRSVRKAPLYIVTKGKIKNTRKLLQRY